MSCSAPCWADAARTAQLKTGLRSGEGRRSPAPPPELALAAFPAPELHFQRAKELDASSGGCTSCTSSGDVWDDDDVSTVGSSSSDDASDGWTARETKTAPPLPPKRAAKKAADVSRAKTQATTFSSRRVLPMVRPLELAPPLEYDLRSTNGLMKCVSALAPLPTPEQLSAKHLAINELQRVVDVWLRRTLDELERESDDKSEANATTTATLLLGGSWHLKVGLAESDLDVVALMPHAVTADHFFSSLCAHLAREATVSKLVARRKAAVPVLSFQLSGVRVDLLFARYAQAREVPKHLPFLPGGDLQVLRGMDVASVRSLSVPRVASLILELVPNANVFRSCLRVVRLWAQRRGLYSNKAGYLGGISWALLVCFVCQMFPRATVASLVHRFFSVLASWRWPTPILVAQPSANVEAAGSSCAQWDPRHNHHDRAHLMPIITPGFPAVNTAVNVNLSTLRVLREEFARGQRIMDDLRCRGLSSPSSWNQLFTPTEVLVRYDHHLVVELRAPTEEALAEWSSFVASRTRKLVETLQHTPSVASLQPLPELIRPHDSPVAADATADSVVGYYFIGYTVQAPPLPPSPVQRRGGRKNSIRAAPPVSAESSEDLARNCVASATRYFLATELNNATERKAGMQAEITYRAWHDLPSAIFPGGRCAAAGERARYILSQAHHVNLALGLGR